MEAFVEVASVEIAPVEAAFVEASVEFSSAEAPVEAFMKASMAWRHGSFHAFIEAFIASMEAYTLPWKLPFLP